MTALAAALLLAGCTSDGEPSEVPAPSGSPSAGADDEAGTAGSGSGAAVADFDPEDVLVEQTVAVPSSPEDQVTIGVQSLTVQGEVMVLRLVMTPDFSSVSDDAAVSVYEALDSKPLQATLVDRENLKEYSVITDSGRQWATEVVTTEGVNGSPIPVWAVFAAPEDDIDTVDLRIEDAWPEFTDVPITR